MNNGLTIQVVTALPSELEPNSLYQIGTIVYLVDPNMKVTAIGQNPIIGQVALVAGTKAVTIAGAATTSIALVQLVTPAGASLTVERQAVMTANTLTITALLAAKTINAADTSTVNYMIFI